MSNHFEGAFAVLSIAVVLVNIALLTYLVWIYRDMNRQVRSPFTRNLLLFPSFLLLQQVIFLWALVYVNLESGPNEGGPLFLLNLIETAALVVLFRTARQ